MPLFGHKNKNHGDSTDAGHGTDPAVQDFSDTNPHTSGTGTGTTSQYPDQQWGNNANSTSINDPNASQHRAGSAEMGSQTRQQGHGHHTGAAVGSAALREQGMLHNRQAETIHAQSQELAEAERLEEQAREHRARAVAQGAHPMNKQLGVGQAGPDIIQSRGTNPNI